MPRSHAVSSPAKWERVKESIVVTGMNHGIETALSDARPRARLLDVAARLRSVQAGRPVAS